MPLSLNKQKQKDLLKLIKQEALSNGWKFRGNFAYKTIENLFFKISFEHNINKDYVCGALRMKPLIIDEKFWEIVNLVDNNNEPLSLRANGAFVINSKRIFRYSIDIAPEAIKSDIQDLFKDINIITEEHSLAIKNIDDFINFIENNPAEQTSFDWFDYDLLIVSTIIQKEYDKALTFLKFVMENRKMGGWIFDKKSFYEIAVEYCETNR